MVDEANRKGVRELYFIFRSRSEDVGESDRIWGLVQADFSFIFQTVVSQS